MPTRDELWEQRARAKTAHAIYTQMRRQAWASHSTHPTAAVAAYIATLERLITQHAKLIRLLGDAITDGEGTCAQAGAGAADTLTVNP